MVADLVESQTAKQSNAIRGRPGRFSLLEVSTRTIALLAEMLAVLTRQVDSSLKDTHLRIPVV